MSDDSVNYSKEAFLHPWNISFLLIGLAATLALGWGTSNGTLFQFLLMCIIGLELLVLGHVPRLKRFRRIVDAKLAAERSKPATDRELYSQLGLDSQRRYARMRNLKKKIESNYRKYSYASRGILENHLEKISGLLNSCLRLLVQRETYVTYGKQANEHEMVTAMAALRKEMERDPERVRSIKQRRVRVLEQRVRRVKTCREQLEVINAQVATIEDVVKYIHEQSITLRNPEEITLQLDHLLNEVEGTEAAVAETESLFAFGDLDRGWLEEGEQERSRVRVGA